MRILVSLVLLAVLGATGTGAALYLWPLPEPRQVNQPSGDIKRGAYLARTSGCVACHTSDGGEPLAGGVELESPFGTFVSPNITPDPNAGIGGWTFAQFARAVRQGVAPEGHSYYPAFPYEFYADLSDRDIADIWTALNEVPPVASPAPPHEVGFPFNIRVGLKPWRTFFARPHDYTPIADAPDGWNRGKFLVNGPAHCGACHTPRNLVGGLNKQARLEGEPQMMNEDSSPAITAEALAEDGWSRQSLVGALKSGITPDGDALGGSMRGVVHDSTSYMLESHLEDMASYLLKADE